jgi:Cu(I)/Ag(I) efflux system membrane fusion protein
MSESKQRPAAVFVALLVLALGACRESAAPAEKSPASFAAPGLHVEVSLPEGPAREGENELRLCVRDATGAPVDDARVGVAFSMPMAGMATMGGQVAAEPIGKGEYRARVNLEMSGTWLLELHAARPSGDAARVRGSLRTGSAELRLDAAPAAATEGSKQSESGMAEVRVDPARLQQIGVRFATVERAPFVRTIRSTGSVGWDESELVDVSMKLGGFVRELYADALGAPVDAGEPLFTVYSPALYAAQVEYLDAKRAQATAGGSAAPERGDALLRASRARLRLWDFAEIDIRALEAHGAPLEAVPIRARASGYLIEKNVVAGAAFEAGTRLFRIAKLDRVWIDAQVFESDAPWLRVGAKAIVRAPGLPGAGLEALVAYVQPTLDASTRTLRARLEVSNADLALRPEMWVEVELPVDLGPRLQIPASAVIYAGARRVVFVDRGEGRLEPREIETGASTAEAVEVVSGLAEGERVVAAGNFLIAAESRLRSALEQW